MISLIVAYSLNRVIGNKGRIPWNIPGEKKRFKELTEGNIVIIGRKSFEEIGSPLSNRTNIVVSRTKKFIDKNCFTVSSLRQALYLSQWKDVFISGGERLYRESISLVNKMYITEIEGIFSGDVFFPWFDEKEFDKKIEAQFYGDIPYRYVTYTRKNI